MASTRKHSRAGTRRLMARYLDPSRRWDAASDARMRERMADNEADRDEYRGAIMAARLMTSGDARQPTRVEDDRRLDSLLDRFAIPDVPAGVAGTAATPTPHPRTLLRGLASFNGLLAALGALALVVVASQSGVAERSDGVAWKARAGYDITARGGADVHEQLVGYGITGVTEQGDEYEVLAAGRAYRGDYFRFSYTNDAPDEVGYVFLFGLQRTSGEVGAAPLAGRWYAPNPDEARSAAAPKARTRFFDFEARLASDHTLGDLRVVGLFTPHPLEWATVQAALLDVPADLGLGTGLESWLRVRLGLSPAARVQIRDTTVVAGSVPTEGL